MAILNLTPHELVLVLDGGRSISIPPSGQVARCAVNRTQIGATALDGAIVPVFRTAMGAVEGLPDPESGVLYVVSRVVAEAARGRPDVLIPDDAVRDEAGRVVGCRALARL